MQGLSKACTADVGLARHMNKHTDTRRCQQRGPSRSRLRSIAHTASGRPAPQYGAEVVLFVTTTRPCMSADGTRLELCRKPEAAWRSEPGRISRTRNNGGAAVANGGDVVVVPMNDASAARAIFAIDPNNTDSHQ